MAISLRATSVGPNSNATSTAITLPAGTTTNDLTVIAFANAGSPVTPPAGWTVICNAAGSGVVYRLFQAGDPSSVTFTCAAAVWWESCAISYIGCDLAAPVDASNSCYFYQPSASALLTAQYLAPSINPNWQSDQLLAIYTNNAPAGAGSITLPGGFTSRISTSAGPSVAISDQTMGTSNTPSANARATWRSNAAEVCLGCQVALKAAGAVSVTPAAPRVVFGSIVHTYAVTTINLDLVNPQPGDLIAIFATTTGTLSALPAGYTTRALLNNSGLFTKTYQAGDPNPTIGSVGNTASETICLRTSGVGGTAPAFDQTANAGGTGSAPVSGVLPSLTPANATEYLIAGWLDNYNPGGTFTPPGGLTAQLFWNPGLFMWIGDTQPAATPTGTLTGTTTGGAATNLLAVELLVSVAAATNVLATQIAAEHWLTTSPDAQVTQIALEHWASLAIAPPTGNAYALSASRAGIGSAVLWQTSGGTFAVPHTAVVSEVTAAPPPPVGGAVQARVMVLA